MWRSWDIHHKRECKEVCINPKEISYWVTSSAGMEGCLSIWAHLPSLVSKYLLCCPIEMLSVTVNPGDEASAYEYETTNESWKKKI
jgi:hypothetical protein